MFELPEYLKQKGVRIVSDEEYQEMCKIDKNFCTDDEDSDDEEE